MAYISILKGMQHHLALEKGKLKEWAILTWFKTVIVLWQAEGGGSQVGAHLGH